MATTSRVRPRLLYDGKCGFCSRWVARWRARTGDAVVYRPSRLARRAVWLIDGPRRPSRGADAVFRALGRAPRMRLVSAIARLPVVRWLARAAYRFIAAHRAPAARIDRLLFGRSTAAPTRRVVRWLFLRCLGGVYLIAFTSLRAQVLGLYGSRGIQPLGKRLADLRQLAGRDAYRLAPTLLWLGSSDRDLLRFCRAGQLCAVALMLDVAPRTAIAALWALYLSFVSVGRDFLSFQWDALLLETGVHALLASAPSSAPAIRGRAGDPGDPGDPPWLGSLLMRWLVFRLHFQSGLVKLRSRDATWRGCTACPRARTTTRRSLCRRGSAGTRHSCRAPSRDSPPPRRSPSSSARRRWCSRRAASGRRRSRRSRGCNCSSPPRGTTRCSTC
jgi:predicted DCC family thiol-disulfide oxidoreductase YuxK